MLGTITAIIAAILIAYFSPYTNSGETGTPLNLPQSTILLPIAILALQMLLFVQTLSPLQRQEEKMTPRLFELLKGDNYYRRLQAALFVLNLVLLFTILAAKTIPAHWLTLGLASGLILVGIIFDLLRHSVTHIGSYLNPFTTLKMMQVRGKKSIAARKEEDLCDWIDSLLETALKALSRHSPSLCNAALQESSDLMHAYLNRSTQTLSQTDATSPTFMAIEEKAQYLLFYLFDRLEMIYHTALQQDLSSVCSSVIALLGKLALHAAEYKISFSTHPIQLLGKFTMEATQKKALDATLKGTCTLVELSKAIAENVDPSIPDFKEPFFSALLQLDEIAKEAFRKDKSINIKLLTFPFLDLKAFFQTEPLQSKINSPLIINEINRILAEWDTLETVLRTLPPKPIEAES